MKKLLFANTFTAAFSIHVHWSRNSTWISNGNIDSSSVQVNLTNQNPDAARPGEPVELTVSVQNVGQMT